MKHYPITRALIVLFLLASILVCQAQTSEVKKIKLQQKELQHVVNNAFGKIVTSNANSGEIANYASVDPVNALFSLKTTIPIRKKKRYEYVFEENRVPNPGNISFLSFSISGGLADKNYGALFSDSKLNAGVTLGGTYNFSFRCFQHATVFEHDLDIHNLKRTLLFNNYKDAIITLQQKTSLAAHNRARELTYLKQVSNADKLQKNQEQLRLLQSSVDALGTAISSRPGLADTLLQTYAAGVALQNEATNLKAALDSFNLAGTILASQQIVQELELKSKTTRDYDTLVGRIQLQKLAITWFTFSAEYLRKGFTTFSDALPFEQQIDTKQQLNGYSFGFAVNHLIQSKLFRRTFFVNAGIYKMRNNNLALLSTTTIEQTKTITNSAGDTVRKITKKYNAYTKPVEIYKFWNLSAHLYYIFGKTPKGFHFFPSLDLKPEKHKVANCTLGYIMSFQNTAKDQPVLNAELYVRFNDIFNDAKLEKSKFYSRNEIGVSFTVPFNIF